MFIIKNKGTDTIKSYSIKLTNDKVSLIKTQKDTPISDEIKVDISIEELGDLYNADVELAITYSNNKSHLVKAVNFDPVTFNMEVTTYGSNKKLKINSSSLSGVIKKDVISENFKIIQTLVNDYFNSHSIPTIEEVRNLIPTDYITEQDLRNIEIQGRDGKDGKDGKDAYRIAVENGYEGTEAEFGQVLVQNTVTMTKSEMLAILNEDEGGWRNNG